MLLSGYDRGYLSEIVSESRDSPVDFHTGLKSGLEAKSRTEDETGIVFLQPQHMQHGVYTILSRWWTTRKKELKKQWEPVHKSNCRDASPRSIMTYTPSTRCRLDGVPLRGLSPLASVSMVAFSPWEDLVKNYRAPDALVDFHTGWKCGVPPINRTRCAWRRKEGGACRS